MKRFIILLLTFIMVASGCSDRFNNSRHSKYSYAFLGTFDTVIQFIGYAETEKQFDEMARKGQTRFEELDKLYDIYNNYEGINNIKTINDNAGIKPVEVSQEIIDIIQFSKEWNTKTNGQVNIALGPVLSIWHKYREEGIENPSGARLPDIESLKQALSKTDISKVEVDEAAKTVFLSEPGMSLDVGAVAKGFATEVIAKELENAGYKSFIINGGGNVKVVGKPLDGVRDKWSVEIQNPDTAVLQPDNNSAIDIAYVNDTSMVTSGDYQRYYTVNGQRYHHIIDPKTLMPATYFRAVTVMTEDSGLADFMSTTTFLLPYEESRALVESIDGLEALWIMPDGSIKATDGMMKVLKNMGGATNKDK